MKRFITGIFMFAIFLLVPNTTLAQTSITPADILPADIEIVFSFSTENPNILSEYVIEEIKKQITPEETKILEKITASNTFTYATKISDSDLNLPLNQTLFFHISAEDLKTLLTAIDKNYTTTTHNQITFYRADEKYIIYFDGLLALTEEETFAKQLIDNYKNKTNTLANQNQYKNALSHQVTKPFLNFYLDPSVILHEMMPMQATPLSDYNSMYIDALLAEFISVSQTTTGFDFSIYIESDKEKLEAVSLFFNKYNFVPSLYKKISGTDLLFYAENSKLNQTAEDILKIMETESEFVTMYDEYKSWFQEETTINFDDLLKLINSNYLVTAHKTAQAFPAITFMADVTTTKDIANNLAQKLNSTINEMLLAYEDELGINVYSSKQMEYGGGTFIEHIVDVKALMGGETVTKTSELRIHLSIGVTNDGLLIITTHPKFSSVYLADAEGLTSNTKFNTLFTERNEEVTQILFMDFDNLATYLNTSFTIFEAPDYIKNMSDKLLAPWHSYYSKSYATENSSWVFGKINASIEKFANYQNALEEFFKEANDYYKAEYIQNTNNPFCDVSRNDWFHLYVTSLHYDGIVSGYPSTSLFESCFLPGQDIARAEYTKMVVKALQKENLLSYSTNPLEKLTFSDVTHNDWFLEYVDIAVKSNLVKGYADGTFRGNNNITRAEAVEILKNAALNFDLQIKYGAEPFIDVMENDWFHEAVSFAYQNNLASGVTAELFEPGRNINRAEASKIIHQFMLLASNG
jgi:hypothetical protein